MEGEQRSQIRVAKGETHKSRHRGRVISICFDGQPIDTRRPIERRWSNRSDSYKSDLVGISFSRMPRISRSAAVRCTNRLRINIQHRQGCYTCTRAEATNRAKPEDRIVFSSWSLLRFYTLGPRVRIVNALVRTLYISCICLLQIKCTI